MTRSIDGLYVDFMSFPINVGPLGGFTSTMAFIGLKGMFFILWPGQIGFSKNSEKTIHFHIIPLNLRLSNLFPLDFPLNRNHLGGFQTLDGLKIGPQNRMVYRHFHLHVHSNCNFL